MPVPSLENLDKSTWRKFRFDEIAQSIGERVEPTKTDLEIYVGLDHIDSESIHIKRFGKREDVSGTKLRCYPGDVIFGRRRAYQRKAAICEFDGFCSAHSLVLRAKPDVIDPKLFPFFLHSDTFMDRAVDISVGSLSPTINWGTLKKQEFLLPPKDQQAKLAELLWAADEGVEAQLNVIDRIQSLTESYRSQVFSGSSWPKKKLKELFSVQLGKMLSPKAKGGISPFPYLANASVQWDSFDLTSLSQMDFSEKEREKFSLRSGDLLVCEGGDVGRSAVWRDEIVPCYYQKAIHRLRPLSHVSSEIMLQFMIWAKNAGMFSGHTGHSTIAHLTAVMLMELEVPVPPKESIPDLEGHFSELKSVRSKCEIKLESLRYLRKTITEQIF